MVAITRIPPAFIFDRLDGRYNSPTAVVVRKKIKSSGFKLATVSSLFELVCGPFGSTLTADEHSAEGEVLLIQPTNISGDVFSEDSSWRITQKDLIAKGLKLYKPGTLLFARVGVYPHTGILPAEAGQATISSSMIAGIPKRNIDTHYVCAFFKSHDGYQLLLAAQKVTAQPTIGTTEIGSTEIPTPDALVQKYIGDKVRQAELLRAWAKLAETQVNQYHQKLVPQQTGLNFAKRVRVVSIARMSERLDAHFYPGVVDEYLRLHQGKFKQLGKLCVNIYNGQTQPETDSSNSCKQITVTNLSSSFLGGIPRDVEAPGKQEKFLKAYDILMCNAAHNKTYIGKDLTFMHSEAAILPSTEVMTIRVDRDQVPASYVRAYLLTKLGYVQIQSTIRGITAHSYPDDMALLDIYIPEVADRDKAEWFACDEKLALAGKACEVATQLTHTAKLLVEALIEGQLTETELIAAEQALQAGNDEFDRRILNRLKTDRVDGQGQALFGDLDELYHLLKQAEGD